MRCATSTIAVELMPDLIIVIVNIAIITS